MSREILCATNSPSALVCFTTEAESLQDCPFLWAPQNGMTTSREPARWHSTEHAVSKSLPRKPWSLKKEFLNENLGFERRDCTGRLRQAPAYLRRFVQTALGQIPPVYSDSQFSYVSPKRNLQVNKRSRIYALHSISHNCPCHLLCPVVGIGHCFRVLALAFARLCFMSHVMRDDKFRNVCFFS